MKRALAAGLFAAAMFILRAGDLRPDSGAEYSRWIKPWSEHATNSAWLGDAGLKLVVTTVGGEQPLSVVTNMTTLQRLVLAYHLKIVATEITTNGLCHSSFVTNTGGRDAALRQLSAAELRQLDELLARLPDDDHVLPPPGRRVVVQVFERDHRRLRVYDGKTAPTDVISLLKLIENPFDEWL